jgi:hypothetical protein
VELSIIRHEETALASTTVIGTNPINCLDVFSFFEYALAITREIVMHTSHIGKGARVLPIFPNCEVEFSKSFQIKVLAAPANTRFSNTKNLALLSILLINITKLVLRLPIRIFSKPTMLGTTLMAAALTKKYS